jgi:hypothetical protein
VSCLNKSGANLRTFLQKAAISTILLNKIYHYLSDFKLFLGFLCTFAPGFNKKRLRKDHHEKESDNDSLHAGTDGLSTDDA